MRCLRLSAATTVYKSKPGKCTNPIVCALYRIRKCAIAKGSASKDTLNIRSFEGHVRL